MACLPVEPGTMCLFAAIALFVLVIACINFMNMATARSERRAREVGVRKAIGSRRSELDLSIPRRIVPDCHRLL